MMPQCFILFRTPNSISTPQSCCAPALGRSTSCWMRLCPSSSASLAWISPHSPFQISSFLTAWHLQTAASFKLFSFDGSGGGSSGGSIDASAKLFPATAADFPPDPPAVAVKYSMGGGESARRKKKEGGAKTVG